MDKYGTVWKKWNTRGEHFLYISSEKWLEPKWIELNSRFNVMTIDEVALNRPESLLGFSVIFCFCRLETLLVRLEVFL